MAIDNKKLILEFFKDYKPIEKNNVLTISKAPKEFESIFEKKAPYKLVFSLEKYNATPNSEFITKGSYFLSSLKEFMENKGQTSLIKLNIKISPLLIKKIPLGNCSILKTQKKVFYNFLPEFTFFSNLQALNEKRQLLKKYLIKDKEILDLDLTKFNFLKSNPKEIPNQDLKEQYEITKNDFKKYLKENIKDFKINLKEKLEIEFQRIKKYYLTQIKEKDDETDTCQRKINNLKSKLKHTYYKRDINTLKRNIKDSKVRLEMLKKRGYNKRLNAEEKFHLRDEIDKHALIIENKLVNVTIFYYQTPVFSLSLNKKSKNNPLEISKTIEILYDSLFKKFELGSLTCESCKKNNINEINLCSIKKHLVCKTCLKKCRACKRS